VQDAEAAVSAFIAARPPAITPDAAAAAADASTTTADCVSTLDTPESTVGWLELQLGASVITATVRRRILGAGVVGSDLTVLTADDWASILDNKSVVACRRIVNLVVPGTSLESRAAAQPGEGWHDGGSGGGGLGGARQKGASNTAPRVGVGVAVTAVAPAAVAGAVDDELGDDQDACLQDSVDVDSENAETTLAQDAADNDRLGKAFGIPATTFAGLLKTWNEAAAAGRGDAAAAEMDKLRWHADQLEVAARAAALNELERLKREQVEALERWWIAEAQRKKEETDAKERERRRVAAMQLETQRQAALLAQQAAADKQERAQQYLRQRGNCVAGFPWTHRGGGRYVCAGGTHHMQVPANI
jgi:hypothetical protein